MILRTILHKSGFRFRIHYPIYGKPDIVFPKNRIAIFINGCFWHQHGCKNSVVPKTNTEFWTEKLSKNIERDKLVSSRLKNDKWIQKIIWECRIEKNPVKITKGLIEFLYKKGIKVRKI